jgi:predicted molibdopterin-dependent oxidoreductase YjgC
LDFTGIKKSIKEGKIKALYLIDDDLVSSDPELESILSKLDLFIVHASNHNKTTALADVLFPSSTFAEKNGTFVNFDGMIQRIRPAVSTVDADRAIDGMAMSRLDKFGTKFDRWAKGKKTDARAVWRILISIAGALGHRMKFNMAEEVFAEMSNSLDAFKGLNYDDIGENGIKIKTSVSEPNVNV